MVDLLWLCWLTSSPIWLVCICLRASILILEEFAFLKAIRYALQQQNLHLPEVFVLIEWDALLSI